jgi:hypothetical protein
MPSCARQIAQLIAGKFGNTRRDSLSEHTSDWWPGVRSRRAASAQEFLVETGVVRRQRIAADKVQQAGTTCDTGGAPSTIAWVMPVRPVMNEGMRTLQLISDT